MESPEFDPYLKWLGIRSLRRPPNHYRLLGLELFESDPDVISHAADARIAHIRNFLTGPHRAVAEKILQELKTAKAALLDPVQKASYDQQLRADLDKEGEPVSTAPSLSPPPLPGQNIPRSTEAWANPVEEPTAASAPQPPQPTQLLKSRLVWISSAVVLLGAILVGALVGYLGKQGGSTSEVAQTDQSPFQQGLPDQEAAGSAGWEKKTDIPPAGSLKKEEKNSLAQPSEHALSVGSTPAQAASKTEGLQSGSEASGGVKSSAEVCFPELPGEKVHLPNSTPETPDTPNKGASATPAPTSEDEKSAAEKQGQEKDTKESAVPGSEPPGPAPGASEKPEGQPSQTESPSGGQKEPSEEKSSSKKSEPQRQPVPSAEEQKRAETMVRDLFKKELGEAKLPPQKLALADKLLQEALATKDDPAAAYVLFGLASGLAAAGGDWTTSIEMIEAAAARFDIHSARMKLDVLNKALPALRTAPQPALLAYELADLALSVMEEAILADQIDQAVEAYKLASGIVKRSGDNDLIQEVLSRNHCVHVFQKQYEAFRAAEKQLATNPDDPAAHAMLGRWHGFLKGLWEKGLEHLARAQPADLASLAQADLAAPEDPKEQLLLAERWLKYADSESEEAKGHIQLRAAYWYRQALPGLSGLDKISAERQLEKLPTTPPLFTPRDRGEVLPGNVALEIAGAKVSGTNTTGTYLIDGRNSESDLAAAYPPASWTILFPKTYRLREIRLLLPETLRGRPRNYGYILAISKDGKRFVPLVDRSKGQWMGWQLIRFPARPVRAIQLIGFRDPNDREFQAGELEAYCIPPKYPPGTPSEPPPGVASEEPPFGPKKKQRPSEDNQQPEPREKKPRNKPPFKRSH